MGIFGSIFGNSSDKPLFDVPIINKDNRLPTEDELLGEDEEIMLKALLEKQRLEGDKLNHKDSLSDDKA